MKYFGKENKKMIGKIKIETPKAVFRTENIYFRSKADSYVCANDDKNK